MEEQIVKLMKTTISCAIAFYQFGYTAEDVVDNILNQASLKLHEEERQNLINHLKTIN